MKKYYIHNGLEQQGPFDIEELKLKGINKSTPIWYDGLDKWTTANNVLELQELLKTATPPPFVNTQKKKSRNGLSIIITVIILIFIVFIIMVRNNPNSIPGIKVQINTPKPIVITVHSDYSQSTLFNQKITVYAAVQNQGGDGNVLVTFHILQDGSNYYRTQSIYLQANQSKDLDETFDEITRLGGKIVYDVQTRGE